MIKAISPPSDPFRAEGRPRDLPRAFPPQLSRFRPSLRTDNEANERHRRQINGILDEHEGGAEDADLCRWHGMSEGSFHNWRANFCDMTLSEAKRLKALEAEEHK